MLRVIETKNCLNLFNLRLYLSFIQIGLYKNGGGEKRYHNGTVEEGALLVCEGIVVIQLDSITCSCRYVKVQVS